MSGKNFVFKSRALMFEMLIGVFLDNLFYVHHTVQDQKKRGRHSETFAETSSGQVERSELE